MQPISADDVAAAMGDFTVAAPANGIVELAGPEPIRMDALVRQFLTATRDPRTVTTDEQAGYFGTPVNDQSLTPGPNPYLGSMRFSDWLRRSTAQK
jgi:uncharacterized protein YbjT (DUF2867 family)